MSQENFHLIDKYFSSGLNEEESEELEYLIENDDEFKREFEEHEALVGVIQAGGRKHLKQRLISLESKKPEKKTRVYSLISIAGMVGVLLVVGYFTLFREEKTEKNTVQNLKVPENSGVLKTDTLTTDTEDEISLEKEDKKSRIAKENYDSLFAANYKPFRHESLEPAYRGENNDSGRDRFLKLYWDENYSDALQQYEELSEAEKMNPNLRFQYANCLAYAGRYGEAAKIFHEVVTHPDSRFDKAARFYEGLMLLKLRNVGQSESIFFNISGNPDHPYYKQSKIILKKLK